MDVTRPLGEAWVLLSRIDGLCGRMLGRAVAKGFDDMRAWVCCLVSEPDTHTPSRITFHTVWRQVLFYPEHVRTTGLIYSIGMDG